MSGAGQRKCPFCAEYIKLEAIKCKHCQSLVSPGSSTPTAQGYSQPLHATSPTGGVPARQTGASSNLIIWVSLAVAGAFVAVGYSSGASSLAAGIALLAAAVFLAGLVILGVAWSGAPRLVKASVSGPLRRWYLSLGLLFLLASGSWIGIQSRLKVVHKCDNAAADATNRRESGEAADKLIVAFDQAAAACDDAGNDKMHREMIAARESVKEQREADDKAAKAAADAKKFQEVVGLARSLGDSGNASQAVVRFSEAEGYGSLSDDDKLLFASYLNQVGRTHLERKEYVKARPNFERLKAMLPLVSEKNPELAEQIGNLDSVLVEVEIRAREELVASWVKGANKTAADSKSCATAKHVAASWEKLRHVTAKDVQYKVAVRAAKRLERCRKKIEKELKKGMSQLQRAARVSMAQKFELSMLDEGLDVRVRALGAKKDHLKITYVLFNRAWAHKITDGGSMRNGSFLRNLEDTGFKKVTFSDGYSESYLYDLEPKPLGTSQLNEELARMGLGKPLSLDSGRP